jgi:FAD/FMN-containing dehydrogenase
VADVGLEAAARLVEQLRAAVGEHAGSVVIERGPRSLRARVDPWGAAEPGALALMRGLKDTFDPAGTLNRGRFVGGL